MAFPLAKLPCRRVRVLDEEFDPSSDEGYSPSLFPEYYDPLYFSGVHPEVFETPESVCNRLRDIFRAESGWEGVRVTYGQGKFLVEDVSYDIRVILGIDEIVSERFHPRTYYKFSYPALRTNPSWLYRTENQLTDSFEGITVREMKRVLGNWHRLKLRDEAIDAVVKSFTELAQRLLRTTDLELEKMCTDGDLLQKL